MMSEKTTARHSTQTVRKVRPLMKEMYQGALRAKENGQTVAYGMSGSMFEEILHAMEIVPVWTENYAGLCAAKHQAQGFLERAEADGYSNVICGYVRVGLGFDAMRRDLGAIPEGAPDGGMPEPDLLLGSSQACDPRYKWYQACGKYMDVPTYNIDVIMPEVYADLAEIEPYYVAYQLEQYKGLVEFLEYHTKRKIDQDKLEAAFETSQKVFQIWYDCDRLRTAIPSPMPSQDFFNAFVPGNFFPCEQFSVDFYQELHDEVADRVAKGIGVLKDEKYRLMWAGGVPPWHTMWLFNDFEDRGAVFAVERMYRTFDPVEIPSRISDPLEKMAYRAFQRRVQKFTEARAGSGNRNIEFLKHYIRDYKIDGMVMHGTKSCRAMTIGQLQVKHLIQRQMDIPYLQLQSDMIDIRDYSEEQWKSSIQAFMETVTNRKDALRAQSGRR